MNATFSRSGYADVLAAARDCGYEIRPLCDAFKAGAALTMLLRHDVDLSLRLALEMAQFEHERGITSTYHILPHNDFYTPFAPEGRRMLARMTELGHEIGLHCDTDVYPKEPAEFHRAVRRDIGTLEEITGRKVVSASQHRPGENFFNLGGLVEIEAYASRVREEFAYVSDSAMSWRSTPWKLFPSRKNLQVLIHPIWWMAPGASRKEKFQHLKTDTAELQAARLDAELAYIEQCLVDREQLDARVARQWRDRAAR
jgi:hypothetical protein